MPTTPTPTSKIPEKLDSKFRFVLVAAERAEQLMQGARARLESITGKKATRIAQEEVRDELVTWDYLPDPEEALEAAEEALEAEEEALEAEGDAPETEGDAPETQEEVEEATAETAEEASAESEDDVH